MKMTKKWKQNDVINELHLGDELLAIDSRGSTSDADGVVMLRNEGGAVVVGTAIAAGRLQHEQLVTLPSNDKNIK